MRQTQGLCLQKRGVDGHRMNMKRRQRFQFSSRISMAVALLSCFAGVLWQLYAVCIDYFAYAVVSDVSLVKVYNIQPPAFSLCLPYTEMIDLEKLSLPTNYSMETNRDEIIRYIQENIPISDLFDMTPDLQKYITRIWVRQEGSYRVTTGISGIHIKKFIRDDLICYRVSHANQSNEGFFLKSHHVIFGKRGGGILGLRLRKSDLVHVSRATLFLHTSDVFPRGDRDYALFLEPDSNVFDDEQTFWTISWSRTIQLLMEPPFVTNCRNNQMLGFENKEHCQHSCVSQKTLSIFNMSIFTSSITEKQNYTVLSSDSLMENRTLESLIDRFLTECNESCWGHNCIRVNYMPLVTSTLKDNQSVVFQVFDQNTLETRITFYEKLSFVNFLVYILSIVGFWFGVSCMDLIESPLAILDIKKLRKRLNQNDMRRRRRKATRPAFDPLHSYVSGDEMIAVRRVLY